MSEVLLHDLLSPSDFAIWQCVARIVEYVYGQGRDGWTEEAANTLHRFCLQHNILLEESYGLQACKVIVHNLVHLKDNVQRFSASEAWTITGVTFLRELSNDTQRLRTIVRTLNTLWHFLKCAENF